MINGKKIRTLFMGTPDIAVPSLRILAERTNLDCVITQPDRPAGRGKKLRPPPVKVAAEELGIPVWQPERLRSTVSNGVCDERLLGYDLFVVLAYGEILSQVILDAPSGACINLHASLLPRWRGASPLQAVLRAGDESTGVSVMEMVRGLDAGPVYARREISLNLQSTLPWLHDTMAEESALALADFLDAWPDVQATEQQAEAVTVCGKLTTADGHIDFTTAGVEIDRQVRAYSPMPGCWATAVSGEQSERLRISAVRISDQEDLPALACGEVYSNKQTVFVGCADGAIILERIQPAGKRAMNTKDWINGNTLPDRLT